MNLSKSGAVKSSQELVLKWAQRLTGASLAICYVIAVYLVVRSSILPLRYLALMILASGVLVAWLIYTNFKKRLSVGKSIALMTLSLLMIVVSMFVYSTSSSVTRFLNKIQDDGYNYVEYSVIAKKDQHVKLGSVDVQNMGILDTDANNDQVMTAVNKITRVNYLKYDNITSQTVALDKNDANMLVVGSSYMDLINENYNAFYKTVEVLSTFKIKVKSQTDIKTADITKPFIVYISGIDTYGNVATVARSDVNILAVVNPQTHKILLVNTPRDYYVQLHGTTGVRDKLTHAGIYGVDMSIKTLQDLYGITIDYYMRVNFTSLTNVIEALGGVTVYSDNSFSSGKYSFTEGYNQLNGDQALAFSRTRYAFASGDRTRGENQQQVIKAIIDKFNSPAALLNYRQVLDSSQNAMQTNLSPDNITSLVRNQLNSMTKWNVESISVDGSDSYNYTYSMSGTRLYVMEPSQSSLSSVKLKIQQHK